jgi:hypothetical protein
MNRSPTDGCQQRLNATGLLDKRIRTDSQGTHPGCEVSVDAQ